jgi:hypothetical protein
VPALGPRSAVLAQQRLEARFACASQAGERRLLVGRPTARALVAGDAIQRPCARAAVHGGSGDAVVACRDDRGRRSAHARPRASILGTALGARAGRGGQGALRDERRARRAEPQDGRRRSGERGERDRLHARARAGEVLRERARMKVEEAPRQRDRAVDRDVVPARSREQVARGAFAGVHARQEHARVLAGLARQRAAARAHAPVGDAQQRLVHAPQQRVTVDQLERPRRIRVRVRRLAIASARDLVAEQLCEARGSASQRDHGRRNAAGLDSDRRRARACCLLHEHV